MYTKELTHSIEIEIENIDVRAVPVRQLQTSLNIITIPVHITYIRVYSKCSYKYWLNVCIIAMNLQEMCKRNAYRQMLRCTVFNVKGTTTTTTTTSYDIKTATATSVKFCYHGHIYYITQIHRSYSHALFAVHTHLAMLEYLFLLLFCNHSSFHFGSPSGEMHVAFASHILFCIKAHWWRVYINGKARVNVPKWKRETFTHIHTPSVRC